MAIVLTVDQKESRANPDRIATWIPEVNQDYSEDMRLEFVRTAGDEMQGLVEHPEPVVEMALIGVRYNAWWLGIGIGEVERPIAKTAAESRGTAFYNAREAMFRAKESPYGFAVIGDDPERARSVYAALTLLASIGARRGQKQWAAVDLARDSRSQREIAENLGISQQAVSQRLRAAGWQEEGEGRWLAEWLLAPAVEFDE